MQRIRAWIARLRTVAPERFLLLALAVLAAGLWLVAYLNWPRPLEVVSFAVGDGDAFLIRAPNGKAVLIDSGSRSQKGVGARVLTPNLLLLGVRKLDAIIITHPDSDHVNGLPDVLDALPTGMLLDPEIPSEYSEYQQVVEMAKQKEIPRYLARAGRLINLGGGVRLRLLAPVDPLITGTSSDTNNNSVVTLLEYGHTRMLFTGDMQAEEETALLARGGNLHADAMVAAHHGSRNGTSAALLDAVRPYIAIISSRGNLEGDHPHPETLDRLRTRGIRILRTDVHGQIHLSTYGKGWKVTTYRQPTE